MSHHRPVQRPAGFAVSGYKREASSWYSDQVLPFDIALAGTNEQGAQPAA